MLLGLASGIETAREPGRRILLLATILPPADEPDPIKLVDVNMPAVSGGMERSRLEIPETVTARRPRLPSYFFRREHFPGTPSRSCGAR